MTGRGGAVVVVAVVDDGATDVEVDEVFVVLSGSATVEGVGVEPIELVPGSTVTLAAGMRTIWTVRETLRKIYVI